MIMGPPHRGQDQREGGGRVSKRPSSFFGRLDFSEKLFDRVLKQNLVAVIGRSGSGKSSVAQAGLLPLLRRQTPPADTWESILFTRGSKPFHRLAARLVPLCSPPGRDLTDIATESEKLATRLASDEVTLASFIDLALKNLPDTTRLIAIVDQFEELFTQTPQEGLRKRFVEELLAASRESNLTVVLTLRADFFGQAIKLRGLSDAIETGLVNVSEMTRAELKEAIEEPARLTGLQFEVGLVDRILDQVEQQPGSLPLLQYALTELWQRRQDGQLTHVAYDAIGGVEGAISKRAEAQFAKLTRAQQKVALPALARLVRVSSPSEEGTDTRQVFRLRELDPDAQAVMLTFAAKEARLVVTGCDETTNAGTVEVAHEALIRSWGELKQWIDKDREFLLWRQQLRPFLDKWRGLAQGKDSALLHGVYLAEARHWLQSRANDLSNEERQFIEASERPIIKSRRWKQVSAAAALTVALAVVGWVWWTRTDSYQVRIVLSQGSALVPSSGCESVADWVRALFYAGRYTQALATIRQVGSPGWRAPSAPSLGRWLTRERKRRPAELRRRRSPLSARKS